LDSIVDKLAWKHNVMTSEVEEVLSGHCRIFKKESAMRKSKILKDMSIYEASDFWDDHDFSEFDDVQEIKDVQFRLIKKKYVGLDFGIYTKIRKKAKKMKIAEDVLINNWLREKAEA
jgi:hypothetical protein